MAKAGLLMDAPILAPAIPLCGQLNPKMQSHNLGLTIDIIVLKVGKAANLIPLAAAWRQSRIVSRQFRAILVAGRRAR